MVGRTEDDETHERLSTLVVDRLHRDRVQPGRLPPGAEYQPRPAACPIGDQLFESRYGSRSVVRYDPERNAIRGDGRWQHAGLNFAAAAPSVSRWVVDVTVIEVFDNDFCLLVTSTSSGF